MLKVILFAIVVLFHAGAAWSASIGPSCGSCDGAVYTLSYSGIPLSDSDPAHETFRITYSIDTNTYSGGGSFLDNVAIKVGSKTISATLFAAPGGIALWNGPDVDSGINAGGCSGSGNGFLCLDGLDNGGKGFVITTGNGVGTDLSFIFDVVVPNGKLDTDAHIKARYVNGQGNKKGALLSEDIALGIDLPDLDPPVIDIPDPSTRQVPEPSSVILIGFGLLVLARAMKKCLVPQAEAVSTKDS
jgi:hypothetical protein